MVRVDLSNQLLQECELPFSNRQIRQVSEILHKGADVNAQNEYGFSGLHFAAAQNNKILAQLLLEHGAEKELTTVSQEYTADIIAELAGYQEVAELVRNHRKITHSQSSHLTSVVDADMRLNELPHRR
jgi:ankyrin repeat protein